MRVRIIAVSAVLLTAACTTVPQASLEDRTLSYGCNDVVAVGRVVSGAYEPILSEDDVIGHGWISATLHVRKVIRGPSLPSVLPVRYFAHTSMRDDRDFMLVLKHSGAGYEITTGQLMSVRPVLVSHCG